MAPEQPTNTPASTAPASNAPAPVSGSEMQKQGGNKNKMKMIIAGAIAGVVLLGGSAGAYFGVILPNKPENLWKKSLSTTAKGYDKAVDYLEKNKNVKGSKAKGTLKIEGPIAGDGNIEAESYENNSKFKLDLGFAGTRYNLEGRTIAAANSKNPDVYLKVDGVRGLGALMGAGLGEGLGPIIDSLDGQWIAIDHTLLDQYSAGTAQRSSMPTAEDFVKLARAISELNKEYLLNSDPNKAVLKVVKSVGKENRDGRSTYHFVVTINKENTKKYLAALKSKLGENPSGQALAAVMDLEKMQRAINDLKDTDTADVWVDTDTKLIRFVRFTDKEKNKNYIEFGLPYNGGDEIPFTINIFAEEGISPGTLMLKITNNTKKNSAKVEGDMNVGSGDGKTRVTLNLTAEINDNKVDVQKPAGAKSFNELLSVFLSGGPGGQPGQPNNFLN